MGKIAYVQGGDLWVKALPDGPPRRLTTDGGASHPRWSPSGHWLTFGRKEQALWVVSATQAGAKPFKVERARSPVSVWFPTQDILTYYGAEDGFMRALDPKKGRDWVLLKQDARGKDWSLSPDGRWIAYLTAVFTKVPDPPEWFLEEADTIWRVRIGSGRARRLVRREAPIFLVGWSRDGTHILFWRSEVSSPSITFIEDGVPLEAVAADGGKVRTLLPSVLTYDDFVTSSPDGTYVAAAGGERYTWRYTWANKRLLVVHLGSGKVHALTDQGVVALSPRWSPDGQWVAYVAAPDLGMHVDYEAGMRSLRGRRVWVVRPDKSQTSQLTRDEDYRDESPLWSADGRHILFLRLDKDERVSVWLMRSDGAEQRQVVDGLSPVPEGYYGHVRWREVFDWWKGSKAKPRPRGQTKASR